MPRPRPWLDRGYLPADMALGQRWGRLRIVGYERRRCGQQQRTYVVSVCLCGGLKVAQAHHLRTGHVQSCGCLHQYTGLVQMQRLWQEVWAGTRIMHVGRPKKQHKEAA